MNNVLTRQAAVALCAILPLAVVAGCPQTQLLSLLAIDIDPAAPASVEIVEPPPNIPPTVDTGGDQTANAGEQVILDGTGTLDPDGDRLLFWWVQTAGTPFVELANGFSSVASFTAPDTISTTTLTFRLTVIDGSVAVEQEVDVVVLP